MLKRKLYYVIKHCSMDLVIKDSASVDYRDVELSFVPIPEDPALDSNDIIGSYIADMFEGSIVLSVDIVSIPVNFDN